MANKKSCVIYDSWAEMLVNMTDESAGQLIKNMMRYVFEKGDVEFSNPELMAVFCMVKEKLDSDTEKYQAKVDRIKENSATTRNRNDIDTKSERNRNDIGGVSESVSVSDNVSPTEIKKREARKRFTPPTVEEVAEYCRERNNNVDPETFVDFYASKDWKIGRDPMKDWKASVRTWEKRNNRASPKKNFDPTQYLLNQIQEGGFNDTG